MGIIRVMQRGGSDLHEYKKAVKMAKRAIDTICDISDEMEEEFSERGDYSERYGHPSHDGYYSRDWDDMNERRYYRRY